MRKLALFGLLLAVNPAYAQGPGGTQRTSTSSVSKTGKNVEEVISDLSAREAEINKQLNKVAANLYGSAEKRISTQLELAKASFPPGVSNISKALEALAKAYDAYTKGELRDTSAYAVKAAAELLPKGSAKLAEIVKNGADLTLSLDEGERGNNETATEKLTDTAVKGSLAKVVKSDDALKLVKAVYDSAKNATSGVIEMGRFGELQDEHHHLVEELGKIHRAQQAFANLDKSGKAPGDVLMNGMYHTLDGGETWYLNLSDSLNNQGKNPMYRQDADGNYRLTSPEDPHELCYQQGTPIELCFKGDPEGLKRFLWAHPQARHDQAVKAAALKGYNDRSAPVYSPDRPSQPSVPSSKCDSPAYDACNKQCFPKTPGEFNANMMKCYDRCTAAFPACKF